jgi:hypothetical protein
LWFNSRDRALITVLYKSGVRVGELGRFRWKDIVFDDLGAKLYIDDQKTKKYRYSRLTMSVEYLANWKRNYTKKLNDEMPVFTDFHDYTAIKYDAVVRILQRLGERAGIKKNVNPHIFRHSRITHLIQQNYQESIIKKSMWGNLNTEMFATYVSLSETDIDHEFLARAGIKEKESIKRNPLTVIACGHCHYINAPDSVFCSKCGFPLTKEDELGTNKKINEAIDYINENPEFQEFYAEYQNFLSAKKEFQVLKVK